jgi:hypothetical protein
MLALVVVNANDVPCVYSGLLLTTYLHKGYSATRGKKSRRTAKYRYQHDTHNHLAGKEQHERIVIARETLPRITCWGSIAL